MLVMAPLMLGLDKYAPFILGSYGAAAVVLGGLILWMIRRNARIRAELAEIERQSRAMKERRAAAARAAAPGKTAMESEAL